MLRRLVLSAALFGVLSSPVRTETNPYTFERGFPANEETIQGPRDATMLRRAIEAVMQQFEPFGARPNKVGIIMPQDPEQQFSIANPDTPYVIGFFDLNQAGPMAVEVPEGPYMGTLDNHHMEWFGDMSTIGSGKGMGEKDLLMPPGYDGDILDGYTPHYSQTRKLILLMRVAVPTGHYDEAVALARKLKVYALGNDASA
ncbi:hypothetical protein NBRC116597_05110 [Phaeobacter sp. NW0010-22]